MSGHSKWATTHRQKSLTDAKRGAIFTKIANQISLAAREGGGSSESNFKLRLAMDKARAANMPNDNVERAIKRGTGGLAGQKMEEVIYEALLPGGITIILEILTDNRNRALSEIKKIITESGGHLAEAGSLLWQFNKRGLLTLLISENLKNFNLAANQSVNQESVELSLIDFGAEDFTWTEESINIYTQPENLAKIKKDLETANFKISETALTLIPKNPLTLGEEVRNKLLKLFDKFEDNPEINNFYSNLNL